MVAENIKKTEATTSSFKLTSFILLAITGIILVVFCAQRFFFHPTLYMQAVSLIKSGKASAALPILEKISQQHPDNANLFPWLALAYLSCDRVAEGRIALDTALRMDLPANDVINAVNAYANFYEKREDFEEAEKLLVSASSCCPPQLLNDSRAKLYLNWAEVNFNKNDIEKAIAHLETATNITSYVSEPLQSTITHHLAEGYKRLSAFYETENNDDKAVFWLEKSLSIVDDPANRMYLAQIYARQNKTQKAIENYQTVADADKDNLEARHHLVDLLIQSGNYTKAQEALVELINKEKSIENYQQLVEVSLQLKNFAGAVHALEDACDLGVKSDLLKQLLTVLSDWETALTKEQKLEEAASVKGHAERVAEQLNETLLEEAKNNAESIAEDKFASAKNLAVALISSRIWLSAGSLTPEGEIKIKNITGKPVRDLTLTAVFFDHTLGRNNGSVRLPVATPSSLPFATGSSRTLYFSCPDTVRREHRLAVKLFWKGYFLKEFPVAKQS